MKNLHNTKENVANDDAIRESSKKKDVNLRNNSSLYFQIGLILCLLATYGLFQLEFEKTKFDYARVESIDEPPVYFIPEPRPTIDEPLKKREPRRKVAVLSDKEPVIADNDATDLPNVELPVVDAPELPTVPNPGKKDTPAELPRVYNMNTVEKVPIFPGCESAINNAERMACMSEKLANLIQKKFNTDLAYKLGLTGIQKIQVQFKIDDTGHVTDIKTRSPYSELEKEAERVVSKIPIMKPGVQNYTPVSVVYQLPIVFKVN